MLRGYADDGFGSCLVDTGDLMEEDKGELVILVCDLDHIAVYRIKRLGYID